jgi:hypothetical protein
MNMQERSEILSQFQILVGIGALRKRAVMHCVTNEWQNGSSVGHVVLTKGALEEIQHALRS